MTAKRLMLCAAALALLPAAAHAQYYRCLGKDGKKYYGQTMPRACIGRTVEQMSEQGTLMKRIEPPESPAARAAREAAEKKKREEALEAKEQERRGRAVLATYTSEQDIEAARQRALADNEKAIGQIQAQLDDMLKRRAGYDKELAYYKNGKPPGKLADDVHEADVEIDAQRELLEVKKKQVTAINARFDRDRDLYRQAHGR